MADHLISVVEALSLINKQSREFGIEEVPILKAIGRITANAIKADRDFPPFNRVTMDGIAVNSKVNPTIKNRFPIEGVQAAGSPQLFLKNTANCIEVMTGAVLPGNTDTVVPYEQIDISDGIANITSDGITQGQCIHPQGTDAKTGAILVEKGTKINPAIIGILATVGLTNVLVHKVPTIAICSTGDELIEIDQNPLCYQIRKSNNFMLAAALQKEGITADMYHLPDDAESMHMQLETIKKKYGALIFCGAVSKGKFDFLPEVLKNLGLEASFHKVAQKPGKPFLFGFFPEGAVVFGFPGNPVSGFVCYHIYFRQWLANCLGITRQLYYAQLATVITFTPHLANFLPVTLQTFNGNLTATPIKNSGSGDLTCMVAAQGILWLPENKTEFRPGEVYRLFLLNSDL